MNITVYHGAACTVEKPLATHGRSDLDFGKGFYITSLRPQAERWAKIVSLRSPLVQPMLNIYELNTAHIYSTYHCLRFEAYDQAWLDFIVHSRLGDKPWLGFDFIEGGVANDRVIDTVESYIAGTMSADIALTQLSQHQPNNQMCLLNQSLIDECLYFKECISLNSVEGIKSKGGVSC